MVRLFYLSGKEFLFLKGLRDRFVGRLLSERKGPGEAKTPLHSKISLFKSPIRDVLSPGIDNPASSHEAALIWNTHDSLFWNWRRVREYFRDMLGISNEDEKEVGALMAS